MYHSRSCRYVSRSAFRGHICLTVMFSFLLCLSLTACSGSDTSTAEWDLSGLSDRLLTEITYTDTLTEMSPDLMDYLYPDIAPADVEKQIIYISTGSTAEELAAFQAVDEKAAERIEQGLRSRIDAQTQSFTDYVPEEVKRLEDAVLIRNGVYVILSVSGDPDTAKEILK